MFIKRSETLILFMCGFMLIDCKKYEKPTAIAPSCYRELKQFVCELYTDIPDVKELKWFHDYGYQNPVVSVTPASHTANSKLIMTLENFDNNTEIYSFVDTARQPNITTERSKIYLFANETGEHSNVTTLIYSLTNDVRFECNSSDDEYVQIGIINATNQISMLDQKWVNMKFNMADNGTMLCCVRHVTYNGVAETRVERFVENKTVLIYYESLDTITSSKLVFGRSFAKGLAHSYGNHSSSGSSIPYPWSIIIPIFGVVFLTLYIYCKYCNKCGNATSET